ncbi:MAG TPA: hypothetical protein VHA35_11525 [Dongiaceae bacterium]|nr:hypothetical protein [Dongiaceae bacterium]
MQTSAFYDTLFGDLPLAEWAGQGEKLDAAPWPAFREAAALQAAGQRAQACRLLRDLAGETGLESRHLLQAWSGLRELNCPEARTSEKTLLGVLIEASAEGMEQGHDILAVYTDRTALYLDHSGAVTSAAAGALEEEIAAVLDAAAAILPQIGPWQGKRLPPPNKGNVRLDFLTPIGLCFGEGPFAAIARDPVAEPLVKAGAVLVQRLSHLPAATVN